jgi:hypothetical protein
MMAMNGWDRLIEKDAVYRGKELMSRQEEEGRMQE